MRKNPSSCDCAKIRTHAPTSEGFEVANWSTGAIGIRSLFTWYTVYHISPYDVQYSSTWYFVSFCRFDRVIQRCGLPILPTAILPISPVFGRDSTVPIYQCANALLQGILVHDQETTRWFNMRLATVVLSRFELGTAVYLYFFWQAIAIQITSLATRMQVVITFNRLGINLVPIMFAVSCVDKPLSSTGRARDCLDGAGDLFL